MISKLIKKFYNEAVEDLCTRILYFFNTIDSFFMFAGITGAAICVPSEVSLPWLLLFGVIAISSILLSDFHPLFILLSIPHLLFVFFLLNFPLILAFKRETILGKNITDKSCPTTKIKDSLCLASPIPAILM